MPREPKTPQDRIEESPAFRQMYNRWMAAYGHIHPTLLPYQVSLLILQERRNVPLVTRWLHGGNIHDDEAIHSVVEFGIDAKIHELHPSGFAKLRILLI